MAEFESSTILILLCSLLGLLSLLLVILFGISRSLLRIEKRLAEAANRKSGVGVAPAPAPSIAETSAGGAFETFLSEDPARRNLPKAEQFTQYRRWRQENGLNWSNS